MSTLKRVIQLDSDDSDNEPQIKPEPQSLSQQPSPSSSPRKPQYKNKQVKVSSTRVDAGGKKAARLEARRILKERKKRRKSALHSDSESSVDDASSSSSDDGLAPVFASSKKKNRGGGKKEKKREKKKRRKEEIEEEEEEVEEDMDDFIASSEEEEEYYREGDGGTMNLDDSDNGEDLFDNDGSSEQPEIEFVKVVKSPKGGGSKKKLDDSSSEDEYEYEPLKPSTERSSSSSKTKSSAPRRSSSQPSSSSRKKQGWNADYGSADDDFINDNSDSDSSASSSSAPFSHAALDAKRRIEEADDGNFLDVFKLNKKMDKREAFDVWFKDLVGQCHGFLEGKKVKRDKMAQTAFNAIERVINTHRESSFQSGAWKQDFYQELTHRPIYQVHNIPGFAQSCDICNRSSHNVELQVTISGPPYDNTETSKFDCDWDKVCSYKKLPAWEYVKEGNSDDESSSDNDDEAEKVKENKFIEPVTYNVGRHCAGRARAYHKLAHFKFIVFDGIKQRMLGETEKLSVRAARAINGSTIDDYFGRRGKEGKKKRKEKGKTPQEIIKRDKKFKDSMYMLYTSLLDEAGGAALKDGRSTSHKLDRLARRMDV